MKSPRVKKKPPPEFGKNCRKHNEKVVALLSAQKRKMRARISAQLVFVFLFLFLFFLTVHRPGTRFSQAHFVSVLVPACCHSCPGTYSHIVTHRSHAHAWLKTQRAHRLCLARNSRASSRNVICCTSLDYTEHVHFFFISDASFLTSLTSTSQRA